jgi:hypothetical protein
MLVPVTGVLEEDWREFLLERKRKKIKNRFKRRRKKKEINKIGVFPEAAHLFPDECVCVCVCVCVRER